MNKNILKSFPKSSGIYQFYDKSGKIIYIGKSVNLFSRVNSYFNGKTKLNFAKKKMVSQIENIKTILTNNETESLILETTLIKKYKPKYNILMKDDKNYLYIKVTDESIPKIIKTRQKTKNGEYFGPYISTNYVNNILKIAKKVFGYRSCDISFDNTSFIPAKAGIYKRKKDIKEAKDFVDLKFKYSKDISKTNNEMTDSGINQEGQKYISIKSTNGIKIPCIDYYIKRCSGPCLLKKENIDSYIENINNIKNFLKGDYKNIVKDLEKKMRQKASNLEFEKAAEIKKDIDSIKSLDNNQIVRDFIRGDYDIINYIEKFEKIFIGLIEIRDSKITGYNNYEIENNLEETINEILKFFIEQKQAESLEKREKIIYIIPKNIDYLSENIKTEIPEIGGKLDLLKLCYKNIYEYATKKHLDSLSTKGFSKKTMQNLLDILGYKQINKGIIFECNDISHISGNHTVASRSIIENGKSNKQKYRKFKIKTLEQGKIDDFSSMKEIIERRLKEIEKTDFIPDLIIIDGGKGQLSSVVKIIENAKSEMQNENKNKLQTINSLQIVSIAKKEEELFTYKNGEFQKYDLDKNSNEIKLIQKIRDEAHRFAITFNRDSRIKSMKKNMLEQIPGIGEKTRKKLLNKYSSIDNLKNIKKEELLEIINKNQLEQLENHGII